jgi:hypothetical protein
MRCRFRPPTAVATANSEIRQLRIGEIQHFRFCDKLFDVYSVKEIVTFMRKN